MVNEMPQLRMLALHLSHSLVALAMSHSDVSCSGFDPDCNTVGTFPSIPLCRLLPVPACQVVPADAKISVSGKGLRCLFVHARIFMVVSIVIGNSW